MTGATLEYMYLDDYGHLLPGEMDKIDEHTKILAFAHVSNVLGMSFPVEELIKRGHAVGATVVLDGAQSTPHQKIDVQALDCDFLFSLVIKCVLHKELALCMRNVNF